MARAVPKKLLHQIAEMDPAEIDKAVLEVSSEFMGIRSDDADPVAIVYYDRAGGVLGYTVHGDTSGFPELEQDRPQPALESKGDAAADVPGA